MERDASNVVAASAKYPGYRGIKGRARRRSDLNGGAMQRSQWSTHDGSFKSQMLNKKCSLAPIGPFRPRDEPGARNSLR
jgi:hypothetical protein